MHNSVASGNYIKNESTAHMPYAREVCVEVLPKELLTCKFTSPKRYILCHRPRTRQDTQYRLMPSNCAGCLVYRPID